jgi:hypothetical protein
VVLSPCLPNSDPVTELVDGGEINGQITIGSDGGKNDWGIYVQVTGTGS